MACLLNISLYIHYPVKGCISTLSSLRTENQISTSVLASWHAFYPGIRFVSSSSIARPLFLLPKRIASSVAHAGLRGRLYITSTSDQTFLYTKMSKFSKIPSNYPHVPWVRVLENNVDDPSA